LIIKVDNSLQFYKIQYYINSLCQENAAVIIVADSVKGINFELIKTVTNIENTKNHIDKPDNLFLRNFPNPFSSQTKITFNTNTPGKTSLTIINLQGKKVKSLIKDKHYSSGKHSGSWDGTNISGEKVAGKIYLCSLKTSFGSIIQKKILLK